MTLPAYTHRREGEAPPGSWSATLSAGPLREAAVINLTKSLSKAYARDGILVNTVSPAFIKTPLIEQLLAAQVQGQGITPREAEQAFLRQNRPHIELGRPGTPEEVASAVVFLASEAASYITGANLRVDGGSVASI